MIPFDTMSEAEAERFMATKEDQRIRGEIADIVNRRDVMDLGCGRGIAVMRDYPPWSYVGYDASAELIKLAKRDNPGYMFHVKAIMDACPVKGVEFAILKSVLEHQPSLEDALRIYKHALALAPTVIVGWHTPPIYPSTEIIQVPCELNSPIYQNHYQEGSFDVEGVQVETVRVDEFLLWIARS